jgi:hypothetical protein
MWNIIGSVFAKEGTSNEQAVIASELALCYHNVKHNLIYNSFDCNTKLSHHIFNNSKVRSKLSRRRTRADALETNVFSSF